VVNDATANEVRRLRTEAGLTQKQLAETVGVSRQTVVSIEGAVYAPSVHLAIRIARVLGTTVEDLFAPEEDHG
jgi:putative transcriptional regulator